MYFTSLYSDPSNIANLNPSLSLSLFLIKYFFSFLKQFTYSWNVQL